MTSRFITYPSLVESDENHPVLVIDATELDIHDVGLYCKASTQDFDIYLYRHDHDDLQWLHEVSARVNKILISKESTLQLSTSTDADRFGDGERYYSLIQYFYEYRQQT